MNTYKWEYLISSEFEIRKVIAVHYLKNCDTIIDVGAYKKKLPINHNVTLHTIDPLSSINDVYHGTFSQWLDSNPYIHGKVGIALLGFHFEDNEEEYQCLIRFLQKVQTIVVEYPEEFEPAVHLSNRLLQDVPLKVTTVISLELPAVKTDGFPVYNKRKMIILERQ